MAGMEARELRFYLAGGDYLDAVVTGEDVDPLREVATAMTDGGILEVTRLGQRIVVNLANVCYVQELTP